MSDSARFALHRPELQQSLYRGEEKIAALMQGSSRRLAAREVLVKADSEHEFVYRLVSGWTCRTRTLPDGRDQCILVFLPGDLFAVKSMFITRHTDDILALSDAVVERIHYRDLYRAYLEDGDVASRCTWQILEEERRLHSWVVGLGQGSAEERLALLLIDFHGRLTVSGTLAPDAPSFEMPLTQVQLADHLGITAVHVNRVLKAFRESGIVAIREREVVISDMKRLVTTAYPLMDTYERGSPSYTGAPSHRAIDEDDVTRASAGERAHAQHSRVRVTNIG